MPDEEAERRLVGHRLEVEEIDRAAARARAARDAEVLACLRDGLRPTDVAHASGLSRRAVYDIRDAASV